jgi:uncharacterized damage-inducible protein DinB
MRHLRRLLEHLEWADRRVLDSLAATAPARAIELYAHIVAAEHVWLARIRGRQAKVAVWPSLTREECAKLARENEADFRALLAETDDAGFAREVDYVNSAGQALRSRVDDILLHVCLHGTYHRGQVALLLRLSELPPAPTDYIAFVRGVPAATRTPAP